MKRISAVILILLLIGASTVKTQIQEPETSNLNPQPRINTFCMKCLDDSIAMIMAGMKKNVARIDSISRRVQSNTLKIAENNQAIHIILSDCSNSPDSLKSMPDSRIESANQPKDTAGRNFSIEIKKK